MILNDKYYRTLWEKYENTTTLSVYSNKVSCLTTKLILEHYQKSQSIHFNFQNSKEAIFEIGQHLFVELANDIYINHYDLPTLSEGNKLRVKRKYADGKRTSATPP